MVSNKRMKNIREYNYDLLRVVSMIAVIMIHISGSWVSGFTELVSNGKNIEQSITPLISCIYNSISRFAVPCFIMLSGAFILDDSRTTDYHNFYHNKVRRIAIPTVIFSILYTIYSLMLCFIDKQNTGDKLITLATNVIKGEPFYHMWFMFILIGLYLLTPVVVRFKNSISEKSFKKVAIIFFVLAIISRWTTNNIQLSWDIGQIFEYLGYYMIGYVIRKSLNKNNIRGIFLIILGIVIGTVSAFIKYKWQMLAGIEESELSFSIITPYSPIIAISSIFIFSGFTMLNVKSNKCIDKLSKMSFIIYLFHAGVWDIITKAISIIKGKDYLINLNCIYMIPISIIIVLLISLALTIIYNKLENKISKRQ